MKLTKAAFFDRDGTMIDDVFYLSSIEQVQFIPHTIEIMRMCQDRGYQLFMVTNQSGVARGYFSFSCVEEVNEYIIKQLLLQNIKIVDSFYCPHHPDFTGVCHCRKPATGMIDVASDLYDIDLQKSLVFGDRESDVQMGKARGCRSFNVINLFPLSYEEVASVIFRNNYHELREDA